MIDVPETQYVRIGDYHIAYQVFGSGPPDLLFMRGNINHLELQWEEPHYARFLRGLGEFARVIVYDDRGSGMSDPSPGGLDSREERAEDALAVLDSASAREVILLGTSGGAMRAITFAASHPERVMALVIINGRASNLWREDYPWGVRDEDVRLMRDAEFMRQYLGIPDEHAGWHDRYRRLSASRGLRSRMYRGGFADMDVRHVLPSVRVSTVVIEHEQWARAGPGRYIADLIPGARFVQLPGGAFAEWRFDDPDRVVEVVREFVTGEKAPPPTNRVLATVLFTDVVGSTAANAQKGDRRWSQTLDAFDEFAKRQVDRYGGRFVKSTGDGHLATFDSPGRAILCACAQRDGVGRFEIEIRAGLHTGEIELRGEDIGGMAVNIGRRVCDAAAADEVIVSGAIPPLVAGSALEFEDRGEHELKGVPGRWQLYAVKS